MADDSQTQTRLTIESIAGFKNHRFDEDVMLKLLLKIKAPKYDVLDLVNNRTPLTIVLVLDVSSSMRESIPLLKETASYIIGQLDERDRLAIVTYSTDVTTLLDPTSMNEEGKQNASLIVQTIAANGNTNLCGGVVRSIEIIEKLIKNIVSVNNTVISSLVLTDGHANVGYTDVTNIIRACTDPEFYSSSQEPTTLRAQYPGFCAGIFGLTATTEPSGIAPPVKMLKKRNKLPCTINTFGLSMNHNPEFLTQLAESGNGMFYFIKDPSAISVAFANCLGGLLSTTAIRLELKLTPINSSGQTSTKISKVYTSFGLDTLDDGSYLIEIPDMRSDEVRDILIDLELPALGGPTVQPVLMCHMTYIDVLLSDTASRLRECAEIVAIERVDSASVDNSPDLEVDKSINRVTATEAIEKAKQMANQFNMDGAKIHLNSAIENIQRSVSSGDPFCVGLVADLSNISENMTVDKYRTGTQHTMCSTEMMYSAQRSSGVSVTQSNAYLSPYLQKTEETRSIHFS